MSILFEDPPQNSQFTERAFASQQQRLLKMFKIFIQMIVFFYFTHVRSNRNVYLQQQKCRIQLGRLHQSDGASVNMRITVRRREYLSVWKFWLQSMRENSNSSQEPTFLRITCDNDGSVYDLFKDNQQKTVSFSDQKDLMHVLGNLRPRRHKETVNLQNVITRHKVKRLVSNFIRKIRLNSVNRQPIEDHEQNLQEEDGKKQQTFWGRVKAALEHKEGMELGSIAQIIWTITNIIQITLMIFVFSMQIAFPETAYFPMFHYFRLFSVMLYAVDMLLNFTTKRYEGGKHLVLISQIAAFYLKNGFIIDTISILIFPIDFFFHSTVTVLISFVGIVKLANNIRKFQKFSYLIINNSEKEQYYGLVKVFLTNFAIGHFLSIFLNLMSDIDYSQNWQVKLGIQNAEWFIKYIWGYYWGTNIMLTVGFGDLATTNYYEAVILIFIETFSCITLAYNISTVGALISSIRQNEVSKSKKLKTFHQMCEQNEIPNEIQSKVCNFIEESYLIKEQFEYEAHDEVLESLPKSIQREYRIEANKILFDGLGFLNNLSKKSLLNLAEIVCRRICHPEQIIVRKGGISSFIILKKGRVGFACRSNSQLDGRIMQNFEVSEGKKPKILSLDFIKNKTLDFNIKSLSYSVLYYLSRQKFMQSLKPSEMDYQLFCVLKDRDQSIIDQNNLYPCPICKDCFHNRFQCSRLHYIPIRQNIVLKYLRRDSVAKQPRMSSFKRDKQPISPLSDIGQLKDDQTKFIKDNYDEEHCRQIQNLLNFYRKNKPNLMTTVEQETYSRFMTFNNSSGAKGEIIDERTVSKFEELIDMKAKRRLNVFWDLEIDTATNYRYYFFRGNPEYLSTSRKWNVKNVRSDRRKNWP